ncbi:glycyl radical protein [Desulfovibrio sp. OttesenSCG-928-I05]|nr:glycyl radical protein [Desulfovibrio sp. OttesenSCG-928-I05]
MSQPCLTEQEKYLLELSQSGENPLAQTHPRLFKLMEVFEGKKPFIDVERAVLFTESMRETEGEALVLRWAKALKHIAERISVYVDDNQLIVGRCGRPGSRYGILYPELDGDYQAVALQELPNHESAPFEVRQEDATLVETVITPYWKDKTFHQDLNKRLPAASHKLAYADEGGYISRYICCETASNRSSLQWCLDYDRLFSIGFKGVREEAQARLALLDPNDPADQCEKRPFLDAMVILSEAITTWARRHAELARSLAAKEKDSKRKEELLVIASNCEWVPENPPRTLHEALQAHWFAQAFARLEQKISSNPTNGRMDQMFWPYYKKDAEAGRMNEKKAVELFQCMWVNMAQCLDLAITPYNKATHEGYSHWEAVTVGGQTSDGRDATNELTYIIMQSKRECPLHYPDLAARIHSRAPERYLTAVADMIKQGCGFPKLLNDDEIIPLHLAKGAPLKDIYDYAASGCAEIRMPRVDTYTSPLVQMNFAAAVELVLYNGRMIKYGDELLTVETGDPTTFTSWEQFWDAYATQQTYLMRHAFIQQYHIIKTRAQHFATPLSDALHVLAMDECIDLHQGHEYKGGLNLGYFECLGYSTTIDSLSAVKKLVFDSRKLSMSDLIAALRANFEEREDIRQMLKNAPCFGNDDEYADSIGLEIDRLAQEFSAAYASKLGIRCDFRMVPFTSHVPFGRIVSATPNGRFAWTPLSDGSSASHGADVKGPTAILLSNYNTKNYNMSQRAARLLNIKFTPKCLEGKEGTRKLVALIRAFCDLRLWHVQFNVVNRETLLNAQKDPEKYRGLIVRIAGYSAYFTELSKDLQDDLIARTHHEYV